MRSTRKHLWTDPVEREGTYILRSRPFGEVLPTYGKEVSRGAVSGIEPAGKCQHRYVLNARSSQRRNRRQCSSTTDPGVINDRDVRCVWAVNDLECAAAYSAIGCRSQRRTQNHQRNISWKRSITKLLKLAQHISLVVGATGDNCDSPTGRSRQSSRTREMAQSVLQKQQNIPESLRGGSVVLVAIHLRAGLSTLDSVRHESRHIRTGEWLTVAPEAEVIILIDRGAAQLALPATQPTRDGGRPEVAGQDPGHATSSRSNSSA